MQADMDGRWYTWDFMRRWWSNSKISSDTHHQYICTVKGKPTLFLRLRKALYGTLREVYLFWKKLSKAVHKWGFLTNSYHSCVANKEILDLYALVLWHVEDLKISHANSKVVDRIISVLEEEFGKEALLTKNKRKSAWISWDDSLFFIGSASEGVYARLHRTLVTDQPKDIASVATKPPTNHLLQSINKNRYSLRWRKRIFSIISLQIYCFCQSVQDCSLHILLRMWENQMRIITKLRQRDLRGTMTMTLNMCPINADVVQWWIDAPFAVHNDIGSHTGGIMMVGCREFYSSLARQKINSKIST